MTPSNGSPMVTNRQSAMSSLRARSTIIVFARGATVIGRAGLVPLGQCAVLLKPQEAPGELDHPTADPGIAGFGKPLFPPLGAALVRRTRQAGVARHRLAVTQGPRQHLIDQHIGRFNADADNPASSRTMACGPR